MRLHGIAGGQNPPRGQEAIAVPPDAGRGCHILVGMGGHARGGKNHERGEIRRASVLHERAPSPMRRTIK